MSTATVALPSQLALVATEDDHFCAHGGVDWSALWRVIRGQQGGGASTIAMQLKRLLFNGPSVGGQDNWARHRKLTEIFIAPVLVKELGHPRVLEIYLNSVPLGPRENGVEAAAQYHFGKSARVLTPREAVQLALMARAPSGGPPSNAAVERVETNITFINARRPELLTCLSRAKESRGREGSGRDGGNTLASRSRTTLARTWYAPGRPQLH